MQKNNFVKYSIILLCICCLLTGIIWFCKKDILYIGMVAPLTGEYQGNGKEMREGIQLYLDELNRKGGLHGKKVKLIIRDDKNDPKRAAEIAQELAENTKVLLVLGHYSSAASEKAGEQYKKFGLPAITSSATTEDVTNRNNWYFATTVSNNVQAELLATYLNKLLKHKKVLLIGEKGNVWAESVAESFIKACEELSFDLPKAWYFHSDKGKIEADRQLDEIISEIWTDWADDDNPVAVFVAAGSLYGTDIASSLRYKKKQFTVVGADSFSTKKFIDQLKK
ncbi:MAG: amino acid ABC transporter substrate-binding protein, partial [Candidatus Electrothrix sp. AX5]|nr:amino acid ABC transporter substrate-binding protein [Candidatus Electrothrix sp. AX5]